MTGRRPALSLGVNPALEFDQRPKIEDYDEFVSIAAGGPVAPAFIPNEAGTRPAGPA
jgi:hypothetical protein